MDLKTLTLGEIETIHPEAEAVFRKHHLKSTQTDNCSLLEVCLRNEEDLDTVLQELIHSALPKTAPKDVKDWEVSEMVDYEQRYFHDYLKQHMKALQHKTAQLVDQYSRSYPEVIQVDSYFEKLAGNLKQYIDKEKKLLFPDIKKLDIARMQHRLEEIDCSGKLSLPIIMLRYDLSLFELILSFLRSITDNYTSPTNEATFSATYSALKDFEKELYRFIYFENQVLFPAAEKLEKILSKNHNCN